MGDMHQNFVAPVLDNERWAPSIDYLPSLKKKWHRGDAPPVDRQFRNRLEWLRVALLYPFPFRLTEQVTVFRKEQPRPAFCGLLLSLKSFSYLDFYQCGGGWERDIIIQVQPCQDDVGGNASCLTCLLGYWTLKGWKCLPLKWLLASAWHRHSSGLLPRPPFRLSGLCEIIRGLRQRALCNKVFITRYVKGLKRKKFQIPLRILVDREQGWLLTTFHEFLGPSSMSDGPAVSYSGSILNLYRHIFVDIRNSP